MDIKTFAFHIDENDKLDLDFNTMLCSYIDQLILFGYRMVLSLIVYDELYSGKVNAKRYRKTLVFAKKEMASA